MTTSTPHARPVRPAIRTRRGTLQSRLAVPRDLSEILRIENLAWPDGKSMRADRQQFRSRIAQKMLLVVEDRGSSETVGFITYFRPRWAKASVFDTLLQSVPDDLIQLPAAERWRRLCEEFDLPIDWDAATDGGLLPEEIHDPNGEVCFAVSITTNPEYSGRGIASYTLSAARQAARQNGAKYFVGYGRLPNFSEAATLDVTEHMDRSREDGGPFDLGLRIHWKAG